MLACLVWSSVAGADGVVFRTRGYCVALAAPGPESNGSMAAAVPVPPDVPVAVVSCTPEGKIKQIVFRTRTFCAAPPVASAPVASSGTGVAAVPSAPMLATATPVISSGGLGDFSEPTTTTLPLSMLCLYDIAEGPTDAVPAPWTSSGPPPLPSLTLMKTISTVSAPSAGQQALRAGPVLMWPHVNYGHYYDKGVSANLGQPQNTSVQELSGGVLMTLGDHWRLDYTGTESIYGNANFRNSFDHDIRLGWATSYDDWVFSLEQEYRTSTVPLQETGQQTGQEEDITLVKISHYLSSNVLNEFEFSQDLIFIEPGTPSPIPLTQNVREWSGTDWVNYEFFRGFSGAIGPAAGFDSLDPVGTDMTFERIQGRFFWLASEKLLLQVRGGGEDRQFVNSSGSDLMLPIGEAIVTYKPVDQTTLVFTVGRSARPSYFINQISENTYYAFNGQQRLFQKLYFNFDAAYQETSYDSAGGGAAGLGTDRQYILGFRLSTTFLEGGTVSAMYRFGYLSSSRVGGFEYGVSRIGFEVGYRF